MVSTAVKFMASVSVNCSDNLTFFVVGGYFACIYRAVLIPRAEVYTITYRVNHTIPESKVILSEQPVNIFKFSQYIDSILDALRSISKTYLLHPHGQSTN